MMHFESGHREVANIVRNDVLRAALNGGREHMQVAIIRQLQARFKVLISGNQRFREDGRKLFLLCSDTTLQVRSPFEQTLYPI